MVKDNCCDLDWLLISTVGRSPFLTYVSIVNDFDKVFISTFLCRWEWSWQIQSSAQVAVGSGSDFLFVFIGLVVKGSMSRGFTLILFHSILFIWTPDWHAVVYSNMGFDFGEIFVSYVRIFTPRCHWKRVVIMCFWVWSIKNRVKTFMTSLVSKGKTFLKNCCNIFDSAMSVTQRIFLHLQISPWNQNHMKINKRAVRLKKNRCRISREIKFKISRNKIPLFCTTIRIRSYGSKRIRI